MRDVPVRDIAQLLGMTQSAISHQLRSLKQSRLVKARREGKTVFYSWLTGTCAPYWTRGWSTWRSCCLCIFYKEMETLP